MNTTNNNQVDNSPEPVEPKAHAFRDFPTAVAPQPRNKRKTQPGVGKYIPFAILTLLPICVAVLAGFWLSQKTGIGITDSKNTQDFQPPENNFPVPRETVNAQTYPDLAPPPAYPVESPNRSTAGFHPDTQSRAIEDLDKDIFNNPGNNPAPNIDLSEDSPFMAENDALPREMIEGEVVTVQPGERNTPDPRLSIMDTAEQVKPKEDPAFTAQRQRLREEELKYEPIDLKVQHTITALFPDTQKTAPQKIRLDVPVIHESNLLALNNEEVQKLRQLVLDTREYQKKVQDLQEEGAALLFTWNEIQRAGSPEAILLPDSPSLIENQGSTEITGQSSPLTGSKTKEPAAR